MNCNKAKGNGKDSHFDINLLKHCFDILNETEMTPDIRYRTSIILASLENEDITSFLATFLTKMSRDQFMQISYMAAYDIEKTEKYLKSNIKIDGINNVFRDFLVEKNKEVLMSDSYHIWIGF